MKTILTLILLQLTLFTFGQTDSTTKSSIYILRSTGFTGSARQFKIFVDGNLACRIKNNNYLVMEIYPGKHSFAIQMDGQKLKENTDKIEIITEAGKNYYLSAILETNAMWSLTHLDELTENSGKSKIMKLEKAICE